jgi:hypothetical protein
LNAEGASAKPKMKRAEICITGEKLILGRREIYGEKGREEKGREQGVVSASLFDRLAQPPFGRYE